MKKFTMIMVTIAATLMAVTAEARHPGPPPPGPRRGSYYRPAPRFRPAHIVSGGGYSYCYYTDYGVPGVLRVYEKPVVATRRYYTTTVSPAGYATTTVVEAPPVTSYYRPVQPWQPGLTIVTPTTEVVTPVQTTVVNPPSTTVYVDRPRLLDVGAHVGVLGVGVGVDVGL